MNEHTTHLRMHMYVQYIHACTYQTFYITELYVHTYMYIHIRHFTLQNYVYVHTYVHICKVCTYMEEIKCRNLHSTNWPSSYRKMMTARFL